MSGTFQYISVFLNNIKLFKVHNTNMITFNIFLIIIKKQVTVKG